MEHPWNDRSRISSIPVSEGLFWYSPTLPFIANGLDSELLAQTYFTISPSKSPCARQEASIS